jgi:predicted RNA binding protein YcfA (HicA-like mRNA interferase family)
VKHRDLVKKIEALGCDFIRHGGSHDWCHNSATKVSQPAPRDREIKEYLAKHILKMPATK